MLNLNVSKLKWSELHLEVSAKEGSELHLDVRTTVANAGLDISTLHHRCLSCTWTRLHCRGLCCTWMCKQNKDLSCIWTYLNNMQEPVLVHTIEA